MDGTRTALTIGWTPPGACSTTWRVSVDPDHGRVVVDSGPGGRRCADPGARRALVLLFRAPLPAGRATVARYVSARHWVPAGDRGQAADPSRLTVAAQTPDIDQHVEVEDTTGTLVSVRSLRVGEGPRRWQPGADARIAVARDPEDREELLVRWAQLPCRTWTRVRYDESDGPAVTVEGGDVPDCDASSATSGVVLIFARQRPGRLPTVAEAGEPCCRDADPPLLHRDGAESIAGAATTVRTVPAGARLARAELLDPRLEPPDRMVWAIALRRRQGRDGCPGGSPFEGPPCRALSALTVYLDAVSGEVLGSVPGGL